MGYPFELPALGYDHDALEPHIDARTMEIHHGKHHQAYTNNLNAALEEHPDLHGHSGEQLLAGLADLPDAIRTAVRNNGGGFVNHTFFWAIMAPGGANAPSGKLAEAIHGAFKGLIHEHRPNVDLEAIATGEYWLASKALELGLVDELQTSDDYLYAKQEDGHEVVEVRTESGKNRLERWLDRSVAWVQEWPARRGWAGPDSTGLPPYRM